LLGIELMPRIRGWKRLKLYRPGGSEQLDSIEHLFTATINWRRIEEHYPAFMRLALAIHSGKLAPSAVLARINSHSSRDPFSMALQELGHAVRSAFLLRWIRDGHLRREVHKGTTKVERSHQFTKFLNFGAEGGLKTNSPADHEKAIVYNELVANAVAVQIVADQTQALHELRRRGIEIAAEDLAHFSPYPTGRVKRFGQYPASITTDVRPPNKHLTAATPGTGGASGLDSIPLTRIKARKSYFPANLPGRPCWSACFRADPLSLAVADGGHHENRHIHSEVFTPLMVGDYAGSLRVYQLSPGTPHRAQFRSDRRPDIRSRSA
jgi:Tn3 transposase DDE domain